MRACVRVCVRASAFFLAIIITAGLKIDTGEVAWRTEMSPRGLVSTLCDKLRRAREGSSTPTGRESMLLLPCTSHSTPTRLVGGGRHYPIESMTGQRLDGRVGI